MNGRLASVTDDSALRGRLDTLLAADPAGGVGQGMASTVEIAARVIWARLVEPGDAVAGTLVAHLGANAALDLVTAGRSAHRIAAEARAAGAELTAPLVSAGLARWRPRLSMPELCEDLDRGLAAGLRLLTPAAATWPAALGDLGAHAPLVLWVRGAPARLTDPQLAIVGARACTGYGAHVTAELADAAGALGATVVSGAAYGIDAVAHRAALAAARPTIAVLAGGADRAYPRQHESLLARIGETGVVCSEMMPGAAPTRWRFLQRNRLIAALAHATLVTEAGLRSGSLNTAGHAATLGRPLGAVPGPVTSAASAGCHRLIRDYGAALVTGEDDLRELLSLPGDAMAALAEEGGAGEPDRPTALHRRVVDALPLRGGRTAEDVAQHAGVGVAEARGALAELTLLGQVTRHETPGTGETRWALQRRQ